jgi:surface antigen
MTYRLLPLAAALLALAACDTASGPATTTKLDKVEVQPGSVSDAMILLDDSDIDGTSVDASGGALTPEGAAAAKDEAAKAAAAAPAEAPTDPDALAPDDSEAPAE